MGILGESLPCLKRLFFKGKKNVCIHGLSYSCLYLCVDEGTGRQSVGRFM